MDEVPESVRRALNFERANWVDGVSVGDDEFYTPPTFSEADNAGKLLKVDDDVDRSNYLLPAATTISRIMYLSRTMKGELVPVSGFILWPYSPKIHFDGLYPVIAWAHGTSSLSRDGAPSHLKNLWHHFQTPYQLALNGYVVVATDYAGLGVHRDAAGSPIMHEYLAAPAQANDIVFSVQAAREAFSKQLSKNFVTIGHSQGGGAVWAVAQRQTNTPVDGCLGCVPIAPVTRVLDEPDPFGSIIWTAMTRGMKKILPETDLNSILTPQGVQVNEAAYKASAGVAATVMLYQGVDLLQPNFRNNEQVQRYQDMVGNGGKEVGCPMLVIQGGADPQINEGTVRTAVEKTKVACPHVPIELAILPGIAHAPALTAGQRLWVEWIADRFAGKPAVDRTTGEAVIAASARPVQRYGGEQNWYLEPATEYFQAP